MKTFNAKILLAQHKKLGALRADEKAYRGRDVNVFHPANLKHCIRQCKKQKWVRADGSPITTLGELAWFCGELKVSVKLAIAQSGEWDTKLGERGAATKIIKWANENEIQFS